MPRRAILPLAVLLTSLAACTGNSPREPSPEPPSPASSPAAPSERPTTAAPTAQEPTAQAPATAAPTAQEPTAQAQPTAAPTAGPGPGDDPLLGTWRSAACGSRKYERVLSFAKGGSFTAEDRVSPCPPKAACIWSGIIQRQGAFKRAGNSLSLSVAEASKGPGGQPFPTALALDAATGAPVETGDGGKPCPYQR
ncbi:MULTISPECIES: hypothetical protein [Sorangium]|uniref:Secreted protein n=1 Tax=Sorangium cellulosum TaxID=56 RepID=A0A4V0NFW0_SORCE|nr:MULTISPECIES: hypothetical protein [Sorangium]AUX31042.1 hypothetical protein SOCE836_031590 [Sorangium cellulosum]WCQ90423.1 hypothetical protein NQZ70_03127 [Sorangium sp. Soce836]